MIAEDKGYPPKPKVRHMAHNHMSESTARLIARRELAGSGYQLCRHGAFRLPEGWVIPLHPQNEPEPDPPATQPYLVAMVRWHLADN